MTQWSIYTPYDTSDMASDVDEVESTSLKSARVVSMVVIGASSLTIAKCLGLLGLNPVLMLFANALTS